MMLGSSSFVSSSVVGTPSILEITKPSPFYVVIASCYSFSVVSFDSSILCSGAVSEITPSSVCYIACVMYVFKFYISRLSPL